MANLQYDISIIGAAKVNQALKGIERRFQQHQRVLNAQEKRAGRTRGGVARARKERSDVLRGFDQIGRAARAADLKAHKDRLRQIEKEKQAKIRAGKAAANAIERAEKKANAAALKTRQRRVGRIVNSAGGALRGVAGLAGGALALGGSLAIGDAVSERIRVTSQAAKLANAGFGDDGRSRQEIMDDLLNKTGELSKATGIAQEALLDAAKGFAQVSGDLASAEKNLQFMADVADAFDVDPAAVGNVMARLEESFKASGADADQARKLAQEQMRIFAAQGGAGSIELTDLVTQLGKYTSTAGQFGGDMKKNMTALGALGQYAIATGGASSAEDVGTAVKNLPAGFFKNEKKLLKDYDINIRDKKGNLKDTETLMKQLVVATGGDAGAIRKILGEQSASLANPLAKAFREAGGGEEGIKVLEEMFRKFEKTISDEGMQENAEFMRNQPERQFAKAFTEFKQAIGKDLLPVITNELLPAFKEITPHIKEGAKAFAKLVSWLANNPFKGIGALVGAAIVRDIAAASIGEALKGKLESTNFGTGLSIAATAIALTSLGMMVIDAVDGMSVKSQKVNISKETEGANLMSRARMEKETLGYVTPQTRKELLEHMNGRRDDQKASKQLLHEALIDTLTGGKNLLINTLLGTGPGLGAVMTAFDTVGRENVTTRDTGEMEQLLMEDLMAPAKMNTEAAETNKQTAAQNAKLPGEIKQAVAEGIAQGMKNNRPDGI